MRMIGFKNIYAQAKVLICWNGPNLASLEWGKKTQSMFNLDMRDISLLQCLSMGKYREKYSHE